MFKTDLEIAQECVMEPITEIAKKAGISEEDLEVYGKYKAKVSLDVLKKRAEEPDGKLILVTAINPTKAGEGKSTTTVGLADGFRRLGKKAMAVRPAAAMRRSCRWRISTYILLGICMRSRLAII